MQSAKFEMASSGLSKLDQLWGDIAQLWSDIYQHWAGVGQSWTELDRILANCGQAKERTDAGPEVDNKRRTGLRQTLAEFGGSVAD